MQKIKLGARCWIKTSYYNKNDVAKNNRRIGTITGFFEYDDNIEKYQLRVGGRRLGFNAHNEYCLESDIIELI